MNLRDVMSRHPLTVDVAQTREEVEHLLDIGRVHHIPLMDGETLVGLWVATGEGLELFGPESVLEMQADADATTAIETLAREHEAVLVWEGEQPVGVLTRTNVVELMRLALTHGLGRRAARPIVMRVIGPRDAGKTTLLVRTLPLLRRCEVAVVMTDEEATSGVEEEFEDARMLRAPEAHWCRALYGWIEKLAEVQLVLIEDTAALPALGGAAMDDILVLVVAAGLEEQIAESVLDRAAAVALTRLDAAPASFDLPAARARLQSANPLLAVFGTAALRDDRGLDEWVDWIEQKALSWH